MELVRCNDCMRVMGEDKLEMVKEDNKYIKGCPVCKTDEYLADLSRANQVTPMLEYLSLMGLTIDDHNRHFSASNKAVERAVTNMQWDSRPYMIGSVPVYNEKLSNVEYDICYDVIERYNNRIPIGMYAPLHTLAENNNAAKFVGYLHTLNDRDDTYANMADEVEDIVTSIILEIQYIIKEIKGEQV